VFGRVATFPFAYWAFFLPKRILTSSARWTAVLWTFRE
jgi:hypothetical protein